MSGVGSNPRVEIIFMLPFTTYLSDISFEARIVKLPTVHETRALRTAPCSCNEGAATSNSLTVVIRETDAWHSAKGTDPADLKLL